MQRRWKCIHDCSIALKLLSWRLYLILLSEKKASLSTLHLFTPKKAHLSRLFPLLEVQSSQIWQLQTVPPPTTAFYCWKHRDFSFTLLWEHSLHVNGGIYGASVKTVFLHPVPVLWKMNAGVPDRTPFSCSHHRLHLCFCYSESVKLIKDELCGKVDGRALCIALEVFIYIYI